MCGRFTQDVDGDDLSELYGLDAAAIPEYTRHWNGAPTQGFLVCRAGPSAARELAVHRWGLVPAWARDPKIGARMINARSETVNSKPSFRSAFRRRRCLVPANGWIEWEKTAARKQPWWISMGQAFSFAGLWERWDRDGRPRQTFTILTCPSVPALGWLHHRQPVIIPRASYGDWLDGAATDSELLALARTQLDGPFDWRRLSRAVNYVRNDSPEVLAEI